MRQKGFAPIIFLLFVVILGGAGYFAYSSQKGKVSLTNNQPIDTLTPAPQAKETVIPTSTSKSKTTPTTKPTPAPIVNNTFVCGSYDPVSRPPQPPKGEAPLFATLYASGGASKDRTLKGFQWDYDGNGTWDTDVIANDSNNYNPKEFSYIYTKNGTYKPKFRPGATSGEVGPTCNYPFDIVVGAKPEFENDTIAVDKLYFEISISRANNKYPLQWYEKSMYSDGGLLIFSPGFNISSKENFTFVSFKESWNLDYGVYDTGANLNAGTSSDFHFFINKNQPNGVYRGTKTVTYTTGDRGTIIGTGPTINYKITLTD